MKPWQSAAVSLFLLGGLSGCSGGGGGGADANNEGDVIAMDPPAQEEPPAEEPSGIANTPLPFHEDFGDNLFTAFDQADTIYFFSAQYKELMTAQQNADYADPYPALWYPSCCFFDDDNNPDPANITVDNEGRIGIVSDDGNPSLLLSNARVTVGQTRSDLANPTAKSADNTDPKRDSTAGDATLDTGSWGEFDLSQPYRISFCVKAVRGSGGTLEVYVDSNQSSTATGTSIHSNPRILAASTDKLVPGERVEINVPDDTGGDQIGSATSFLQFRVPSAGGVQVILDDLLIEPAGDNGQADLPACNTFTDAAPPDAPAAAPSLTARDAAIAVSWDGLAKANSYDLAYSTSDSSDGATVIDGLDSTSTLIDGLENGTTYYVFLRGVNAAGPGDWSPSASAAPEAPAGCSPTANVNTSIPWDVWDGCLAPNAAGAVVVNGSEPTAFSLSDGDEVYYTANDDGTTTLDTSADAGAKPNADLGGVMTDSSAGYPRYFTWIGRINTPSSDFRGFEVELSFGEDDGRRVKTILRPDSGKVQLEKFTDGSSTAEAAVDMLDGYHIYQVAFTLNGAADITARIYRDGENISGLFSSDTSVSEISGTGRDGGSSSPRLRIGEGSSSAFKADVDWLIWTDDASTAALAPADLVGQLPDGLGELGSYAGADQQSPASTAVLEENFDAATDGDGSASNFFTADYKALSSDAAAPFYNVTSGSSRIAFSGGQLSYNNARFSLGDTAPGTDTADTDTYTRGDLDLSQPYRISFDVVSNDNADDGSGKCQVYVDNNTSSSSKSIHGGDSKIFEKTVLTLADGDRPTGTVTIDSDPNNHVGSATSFIQFRCDSGVETPITIDNLVIEYQ
ncbi:fibronectin type III domain-containing protein [Microbulbifer sp. SAOS-129_SWC]|uniref:fibronectin type III domain-containing protein n=1 Tax=Microbulbifer sp. SAOS-129_SWC TaxID=3145235 RepID=UPI00321687E0